jgi:hypothetical protein
VRTLPFDSLLGILVEEAGDPVRSRTAIRMLSTLTLSTIVAILGVGLVSVLLIRRHRRRLSSLEIARRKKRPPPDPWFESGRRVPDPTGPGPKSRIIVLPGPDASDDDTVDIDPEDLEEGDIEGDDPEDGDPPGSRGG